MLCKTSSSSLLLLLWIGLCVQHAAAVTCTERTMDLNWVGGGWLNDDEYLVANTYDNDDGVYTTLRVRATTTGAKLRERNLSLASSFGITCPSKQYIAMTMVLESRSKPLVQPFVYFQNLSDLGTPERSSFDEGQWQMHMSPDCNRLMVSLDDDKTNIFDVNRFRRTPVNFFDSRLNRGWRGMGSSTVAYAGQTQIIRRLQQRKKKAGVMRRVWDLKVMGKINHFSVSPGNKFLFVVGSYRGLKAFKNLALASGKGRLNIDFDDADIEGIFSAYSPTSKHFAGIFTRAGGNIVKVYNSTGSYNGALEHVLLENRPVERLYFSPNGKKLLVFEGSTSKKYWMCGDFE